MADVWRARKAIFFVLLILAALTALASLLQGEVPWRRAARSLGVGEGKPAAVEEVAGDGDTGDTEVSMPVDEAGRLDASDRSDPVVPSEEIGQGDAIDEVDSIDSSDSSGPIDPHGQTDPPILTHAVDLIDPSGQSDPSDPPGQTSAITRVRQRTIYARCGHSRLQEGAIPPAWVGLEPARLMQGYGDWQFVEASLTTITMMRSIDQFCPEHVIKGAATRAQNIDGGSGLTVFHDAGRSADR